MECQKSLKCLLFCRAKNVMSHGGRTGGPRKVVYSDDPSSNPAKDDHFSVKNCFDKSFITCTTG